MFDPFAEKAFDAHSAALLRARPKPLLSGLTPQQSPSQKVLGHGDQPLVSKPVVMKGLRALRDTPRKK
jgi:hypothetical protein